MGFPLSPPSPPAPPAPSFSAGAAVGSAGSVGAEALCWERRRRRVRGWDLPFSAGATPELVKKTKPDSCVGDAGNSEAAELENFSRGPLRLVCLSSAAAATFSVAVPPETVGGERLPLALRRPAEPDPVPTYGSCRRLGGGLPGERGCTSG
mmetsp:Transcript_114442/g.286152  ORF Transcript_114442/g.286152 Transcript_114442/m.286152 type:complete len:151 (-) Transcript_114442:960-1412(-)